MKKFIFIALGLLCLSACTHDNETNVLEIDQMVGEWVYDHPEKGIWETLKFVNSGVFYLSNKVTGGNWKVSNDRNAGRYWIDGDNRVTCQVKIGGVQWELKMEMREVTEYSFTAEFNDGASLGLFTYSRLLSSKQIRPGESFTPEFSEALRSEVTGFRSHNTGVAKVDYDNGTVTGVSAGHTYIDIETQRGTAVVEVTVFDPDNMFEDYSFAFGKTVSEIVSLKGENYSFRDDETGVAYAIDDYVTDTVKYITGMYDKTHVEFITLSLNNNVSSDAIDKHLSNKYELLSSNDGRTSYVTDKSYDSKPVCVIYDSKSSALSYALLKPSDRWTDFKYLFGQNKNVVKGEMQYYGYPFLLSDSSYSKNGSDYYQINDSEDATMVGFVFNPDGLVCEYWVYLSENFMTNASAILSWLNSDYTLSTTESTNRQYVFYDKEKRLRVVFDASGYVSYTDSEQKPFTPAS